MAIRVVVGYTRIHPLADAALRRYAPGAERVDVSRSTTAYSDLYSRVWTGKVSTLFVEHDIELHEHVVPGATYCHQWWCLWPYVGPGADPGDRLLRQSLGCVRFSGRLMAAEPDVIGVTSRLEQGRGSEWKRLDAVISPTLMQRGYKPHIHMPPVLHHHVYPGQPHLGAACACGREHD